MRRAHARSAHRTQTFWFRKHMGPPAAGTVGDPDEYEEMTVEEILTGKGVAVVDRSIDRSIDRYDPGPRPRMACHMLQASHGMPYAAGLTRTRAPHPSQARASTSLA
jgi:hypothetical protein